MRYFINNINAQINDVVLNYLLSFGFTYGGQKFSSVKEIPLYDDGVWEEYNGWTKLTIDVEKRTLQPRYADYKENNYIYHQFDSCGQTIDFNFLFSQKFLDELGPKFKGVVLNNKYSAQVFKDKIIVKDCNGAPIEFPINVIGKLAEAHKTLKE